MTDEYMTLAERILSYVYSANASEPVSKVVASIIEEALTASSVKVPELKKMEDVPEEFEKVFQKNMMDLLE